MQIKVNFDKKTPIFPRNAKKAQKNEKIFKKYICAIVEKKRLKLYVFHKNIGQNVISKRLLFGVVW